MEDLPHRELLEAAFPSRSARDAIELRTAAPAPVEGAEYAAQLALYARTQYAFYVAFQALVFILAAAALLGLIISVGRLIQNVDVAGIVGGIASIVSGGGATFLNTQAKQANSRYKDALKLLKSLET
jgi:hypothetical protein